MPRADAAAAAPPARWGELLRATTARLRIAGVPSPAQDARWLLEEVADGAPLGVLLAAGRPPSDRQLTQLEAMLGRRLAGEPLQYVIGHWAFRTLDLLVDRRVLIPRPETELVASEVLACLDRDPAGPSAPVVVDLGCGSGALALAVAAERPGVEVWGVERSPDALAVARENLRRVGATVQLVQGSWFEPLPAQLRGRVAVVVANPPYVARAERLPAEVADWEPTEALVAGETGLEAIGAILAAAPSWLRPGGTVVIEIGETQGAAATALARAAGLTGVGVHDDLSARPRVLRAQRPGLGEPCGPSGTVGP